jgi:hypothetical protein
MTYDRTNRPDDDIDRFDHHLRSSLLLAGTPKVKYHAGVRLLLAKLAFSSAKLACRLCVVLTQLDVTLLLLWAIGHINNSRTHCSRWLIKDFTTFLSAFHLMHDSSSCQESHFLSQHACFNTHFSTAFHLNKLFIRTTKQARTHRVMFSLTACAFQYTLFSQLPPQYIIHSHN